MKFIRVPIRLIPRGSEVDEEDDEISRMIKEANQEVEMSFCHLRVDLIESITEISEEEQSIQLETGTSIACFMNINSLMKLINDATRK